MKQLRCLDDIAGMLEGTGRYRVLRKVPEVVSYGEADEGERTTTMVVLDVETTGLDLNAAEVLEIGMVKATVTESGRILAITDEFRALQQPGTPIPEEITRLTGIDDAAVHGRHILPWEVWAFVEDVDLVIAHNAAFDRPIVERHWPRFAEMRWACSMRDVDWRAEGAEGLKLRDLLLVHRLFHDGHRAADDCRALVHVLAMPLPSSKRTAMAELLENSRRGTVRIWAEGAPFRVKDLLRARGYRWSGGEDGSPRAWSVEMRQERADEEMQFLFDEVYVDGEGAPTFTCLSALDRYRLPALTAERRVAAERPEA